jgi:hypothetical protein
VSAPVAIHASRWRLAVTAEELAAIGETGPSYVGTWYYTVAVCGARGAVFYVSLFDRSASGKPPYPFAVKRRGRCLAYGARRDAIVPADGGGDGPA